MFTREGERNEVRLLCCTNNNVFTSFEWSTPSHIYTYMCVGITRNVICLLLVYCMTSWLWPYVMAFFIYFLLCYYYLASHIHTILYRVLRISLKELHKNSRLHPNIRDRILYDIFFCSIRFGKLSVIYGDSSLLSMTSKKKLHTNITTQQCSKVIIKMAIICHRQVWHRKLSANKINNSNFSMELKWVLDCMHALTHVRTCGMGYIYIAS